MHRQTQICNQTGNYLPYAVAAVALNTTGIQNRRNPCNPPFKPTIQNTSVVYKKGSMIVLGNCKYF